MVFVSGCAISISEFDNYSLIKTLEKVDEAENNLQIITWQDKDYVVFRYRGNCENHIDINIVCKLK